MLAIPAPGTDRVRRGLEADTAGEVGVGLDELLDLYDMVAGHVLAVGEVVGFKVGYARTKQVVHEPGVEAGGFEVVTSADTGGAF
jgi:hypothetical protein